MQAVNYIHQLDTTQAFSFLAAAIIVTLIFIAGLLINIILYRKKKSNLNFPQAVVFYLKCKCFVASSVIDNYDWTKLVLLRSSLTRYITLFNKT